MRKALFFLFFILLVFSVCGKPPVSNIQTSTGSGVLDIVYPKNTYFQVNSQNKLHFHVFNSIGVAMTNITTNCSIHMYNNSGNHIIQQRLTYDTADTEWFFTLNTTFTTVKTNIPMIVWCYGNNEKGFISESIYIGEMADTYLDTTTILPVVILGFLIIGIYLFVAVNWVVEGKVSILKLLLFLFIIWLIPMLVTFMSLIAQVSFWTDNTINLINTLYEVTMWINITFTMIVAIFLLYNALKLLGVDVVGSFRNQRRMRK